MGENKHIEELDAFAKKYIKEIEQKQPSFDFTNSIMEAIAKESTSEVFVSKPLISKKVWLLILGAIVGLLFLPTNSDKGLFNLPEINFSFVDKIQIPNFLDGFSVSNSVLYALFFFGFMIIAQVIFLKNHFNKRFE